MQLGKPITPDPHFIKLLPYQATKRKLFLTVGVVITVFPFMKTTVTSPLSSHHGDALVIKWHHRITSPQDVQNMTKCVDDSLL